MEQACQAGGGGGSGAVLASRGAEEAVAPPTLSVRSLRRQGRIGVPGPAQPREGEVTRDRSLSPSRLRWNGTEWWIRERRLLDELGELTIDGGVEARGEIEYVNCVCRVCYADLSTATLLVTWRPSVK